MICQCEICQKVYPTGLDATNLAKLLGRMKEGDLGRFIVCESCYNAIERAVATAWLSKVGGGLCTDYMRVCGYCNRPAIATSQESLEQLTKDWDYYQDNNKYCCDKCKKELDWDEHN